MQKSKKEIFATFYNGTFLPMLAGVILYLLALPPTNLWWLGWLVAACWVPILRRETLSRRVYRKIWLCGLIFWGVTVHWVCYAHWATCFGWVAMSCYLGIYFPLFVFFARTLHHTTICGHFRLPVWFAAPIAWLAVMSLQKTLMGGFGFALLEHSQAHQTALIQLADVGGESLVGAVMIFVGVMLGYCLPVTLSASPDAANVLPKPTVKQITVSIITVTLTFLFVISYAQLRESQRVSSDRLPLRVALLQGSFRASLSVPPGWYDEVFEHYKQMALDASKNKHQPCDLIIWPESTCIYPWVDIDLSELSGNTAEMWTGEQIDAMIANIEENQEIIELANQIGVPCIYGVGTYIFSEKQKKYFQCNSALYIDNNNYIDYSSINQAISNPCFFRYDKMLLVMFGEYLPFVEYLPESFFLKTLCQRADFGKKPVGFFLRPINDNYTNHVSNKLRQNQYYLASSNICFESSSSSLIRQQLLTLKKHGEEPDILINISNDGWFRHSSQIDMHLATHIFRAIENRKPYLAATNGGFSVGVDGSGNVLAIGQRAKNQVVYVELTADNRKSSYHYVGNLFHITSFGIIFIVALCRFLRDKTRETI